MDGQFSLTEEEKFLLDSFRRFKLQILNGQRAYGTEFKYLVLRDRNTPEMAKNAGIAGGNAIKEKFRKMSAEERKAWSEKSHAARTPEQRKAFARRANLVRNGRLQEYAAEVLQARKDNLGKSES